MCVGPYCAVALFGALVGFAALWGAPMWLSYFQKCLVRERNPSVVRRATETADRADRANGHFNLPTNLTPAQWQEAVHDLREGIETIAQAWEAERADHAGGKVWEDRARTLRAELEVERDRRSQAEEALLRQQEEFQSFLKELHHSRSAETKELGELWGYCKALESENASLRACVTPEC